MPKTISSISFDFAVRPGTQTQATPCEPGERFNIVLLADFSGRTNRSIVEPLIARKLLSVDVDNFSRAVTQLGGKLKLPGDGIPDGGIELAFSSLEDFHPDKLLAAVPVLARLKEARRLLMNPATAEQGKAALQAILGAASPQSTASAGASGPGQAAESDADTMSRLLGGKQVATSASATASGLDQFIKQLVAPHAAPASPSWQSGAIAVAEMELTNRLNAILHHPDFQSLEAAWRGLDLLVRRVESSEQIGLLVLDVSFAELQADIGADTPTEQSALFRLLRDRKPRMLIGNYTFGQTAADLRALGKLGQIATRLSAPFIATAAPQLVSCDSFARHPDPDDWKLKLPADVAELWEALRKSSHAGHVGLAAPRFLVRQPYGKAGDPIETFPFEELPGEPAHESFLWGHSAVLCACAAIDAIQLGDTDLAEFSGGEVGDLPVHKMIVGGEKEVKPYAEAWITDRAAARMLDCGVMPMVSVKNQNTIRLNYLRSIASESSRLSW